MILRITAAQFLMSIYSLCASLLLSGCSSTDSPPYYTALVTDVYNQNTTVEHFSLLYWWEERGETPFLKPYSLTAKEIIVEVTRPLPENPGRVTIQTEKIPFDNLDNLYVELTTTGKQLVITTRDGKKVTADMSFPKDLKKDPQSGFADSKIYIRGLTVKDGKLTEFKLPLDYVKHIKITHTTDK
jgi:hypothetical protein